MHTRLKWCHLWLKWTSRCDGVKSSLIAQHALCRAVMRQAHWSNYVYFAFAARKMRFTIDSDVANPFIQIYSTKYAKFVCCKNYVRSFIARADYYCHTVNIETIFSNFSWYFLGLWRFSRTKLWMMVNSNFPFLTNAQCSPSILYEMVCKRTKWIFANPKWKISYFSFGIHFRSYRIRLHRIDFESTAFRSLFDFLTSMRFTHLLLYCSVRTTYFD